MEFFNFKKQWESKEGELTFQFFKTNIDDLGLKDSTIHFLINEGLPKDAAPYLSFVDGSEDCLSRITKLPSMFDFLDESYARYIVIGFDGDGNRIVIDTSTEDRVGVLVHDIGFDFVEMNNSVLEMCQCLLVYRNFIEDVNLQNGEDAFFEGNISVSQINNLKKDLTDINFNLSIKKFWFEQIESLKLNC